MNTVDKIKEAILPVFEKYSDFVAFAYLFGSTTTGEITPLSDIDIAVFFSGADIGSFFDLKLSLQADICRALRREDVDVLVLNTTRNLIILDEIIRKGVIILDKNKRLREDFEFRILHRAIDFKRQRLAIIGV